MKRKNKIYVIEYVSELRHELSKIRNELQYKRIRIEAYEKQLNVLDTKIYLLNDLKEAA